MSNNQEDNLLYDNLYFILLSGKAGVGKDYIANKLREVSLKFKQVGYSEVIAYGDYLRNELSDILTRSELSDILMLITTDSYLDKLARKYDLPLDVLKKLHDENYTDPFDLSANHKDPRYRKLLQWYGTDIRRKQNANYWVNKLVNDSNLKVLNKAAKEENKKSIIIIPDVRFTNEFTVPKSTFKHVAFYQITDSPSEIDKREQARDTKAMTIEEKQHISEHGLDSFTDFDYVFDRSKMSISDIISYIINKIMNSTVSYKCTIRGAI